MTRIGMKRTARAFLLGTAAIGLAAPAAAESDSLEEQLRALQKEVQELRERQEREQAQAPANAVTAGDIPGSFKLPGTDTSVAIGGYVKGDVIMNLDYDVGDSFIPTNIPADDTADEETSFRLHARQTRLNLTSHTPTEFGIARIFVEGDFFGAGGNEVFSNSTSFRLRHAYGELGPLLVGQTWSLFTPVDTIPDTIDFFGPAGVSSVRQGQVRYTHQMNPNFLVAFSAENPQLSATAFDETSIGSRNSVSLNEPDAPGLDSIPDFVGAVQYDNGGMHLKLSGVIRQLEVDGEVAGEDADDDELGYGVALGVSVDVAPTTTLLGNFIWGEGVGRYILTGGGQDAFVTEDGTLDSIEAWSAYGGISHAWTEEVTSNLAYGHYNIRDRFFEDQTKNLHTVHVNTWWAPVDQARFGLEYIHGRRNFEDGSLDNSANRVQFGAQYFF